MTKQFGVLCSAVALVCALAWTGAARADILIKNVTLYDGTGAAAVNATGSVFLQAASTGLEARW
mgnify:CR=1 FL=1